MESWIDRNRALVALEARQLFFLGGAPRSGTTWLQQIFDHHPSVSCRGEGLFLNRLAVPLERLMQDRAAALHDKNTRIFGHTGGYPLPDTADTEFLVGTAILLALSRHDPGPHCRALGEKTPENVFFYPRLKRLFPHAKFVGIVRDPRDVLTSAWHFFRPVGTSEQDVAAKVGFVRHALPSLAAGLRETLTLREHDPAGVLVVSYEDLAADPAGTAARLFQFIGVRADPATCQACTDATAFAPAAARQAPAARPFLRSGVVGDWHSTLPPEAEDLIIQALGWSFTVFGWKR